MALWHKQAWQVTHFVLFWVIRFDESVCWAGFREAVVKSGMKVWARERRNTRPVFTAYVIQCSCLRSRRPFSHSLKFPNCITDLPICRFLSSVQTWIAHGGKCFQMCVKGILPSLQITKYTKATTMQNCPDTFHTHIHTYIHILARVPRTQGHYSI